MYQQRYPIILASKSPRRQELLRAMNIEFQLVLKDVEENYPEQLKPAEIAMYVAEKKARAYGEDSASSMIITADTIVAIDGEILGKPCDKEHARVMLGKLSGRIHQVYTGVSLQYQGKLQTFSDKTDVVFRELSSDQIDFYIANYHPFDKAGAYGVQDWIGMIAVERIIGSYTNVMGLPTEKLYRALSAF